MPKKMVSDFEYLNYLKEQYDFLTSDIKQYESGKMHFGIKIAATLRTIFHNTQQSKSILPYLTDKHGLKLVFRKKGNDFSKDPRVSMYIDFVIGK